MAYDPNFDKVSLLLSCNGADTSTTFSDSSSKGNSVTANGNAQISTAQSKFGGASGLFDGTGDYLSIPSSPDLSFGSGDFTIETWLYFNAFPTTGNYFCICSSDWNNAGIVKYFLGLKNTSGVYTLEFLCSNDGTSTTSTITTWSGAATATWIHVAVVRSGNTINVYVNGVAGTPTAFSSAIFGSTGQLFIGASFPPTVPLYFNGYVEDFRITKGVARYTTNFTPSTSEFESYDLNYDKVSLLLHCNGTNGSTTFTDNSSTIKTVTANGNAQISTAQSKFGGSATLFDGTGDCLTIPTSSDFGMGTSDFTIEVWVNPTTITGSDRGIVDLRNTIGAANNGTFFIQGAAAKLAFYDGTTVFGTTGSAIPTGSWTHVALVRSGTTLSGYVNGVLDFTGTCATNLGSSQVCGIGGSAVSGNIASSPFLGYIDEVRVTKGVARYTANFTPHTEEFKNSGMIIDPNVIFKFINFNTTYLNSFHNNLIATNR